MDQPVSSEQSGYDRERKTVRIERAGNGFVVEKTIEDNNKYQQPEPMVFDDLEGVKGYLEECFGPDKKEGSDSEDPDDDSNKEEDEGEED